MQGWRGRSLTTVWPPQVHRLRHNHAQCKKVFWLNKSLPLSLNSMCVITIGAAVVDQQHEFYNLSLSRPQLEEWAQREAPPTMHRPYLHQHTNPVRRRHLRVREFNLANIQAFVDPDFFVVTTASRPTKVNGWKFTHHGWISNHYLENQPLVGKPTTLWLEILPPSQPHRYHNSALYILFDKGKVEENSTS